MYLVTQDSHAVDVAFWFCSPFVSVDGNLEPKEDEGTAKDLLAHAFLIIKLL